VIEEEMIAAWNEIRKSREFHFHDTPMLVDVEVGYNLKHMAPTLKEVQQ
jgi:hypothetical protein